MHQYSHILKHIKMFVSLLSKQPSGQWRSTKSNVGRKQATSQSKVVHTRYIWRVGSRARNIEPLMMVSLVTETC